MTLRMKRSLLVIVGLMLALSARAQFFGKYQMDVHVSIWTTGHTHEDCTNYYNMWLRTNMREVVEDVTEPEFHQSLEGIAGGTWEIDQDPVVLDGAERVDYLMFRGTRRYKDGGCKGDEESDSNRKTYLNSPTTYDNTLDNPIPAWDEVVTVQINPSVVNMYYLGADGLPKGSDNFLPSSEYSARIRAYPEAAYEWYYTSSVTPRRKMPPRFQGQDIIDVVGSDLFTETEYESLLNNGRSVVLEVWWKGVRMQTFPLTALLNAPRIIGVTPIEESCYQAGDAKLQICFSRALKLNETLTVFVNGTAVEGQTESLETLGENNCITVEHRAPGTHVLTLFGKYWGQGTYTQGEGHRRESTIPTRLAITGFTAVPDPVHCHAGLDGKIVVHAVGGAHDYTTSLYSSNALVDELRFVEGGSATFLNLPAGPYTVKLKDINGCDPQESNGSRDRNATVAEPTQSTRVWLEAEPVEPLGFGLTNGHIIVRAEGGTGPYTFQWTEDPNKPRTPEPAQGSSGSMTSRLSGIGKGTYTVRVEDAKFADANPRTETNLVGCFSTLTVVLPEPPLLEVYMEEHRYVSCFGFDDGKLVAHGTGGRPILPANGLYPYLYEWFRVDGETLTAIDPYDSIASNRPSALYRVKITDRNEIVAWSPDYKLIQPDLLTISFNTSTLLCNGDTNGTSQATVRGGTPDYQYTWSTDETTPDIANLQDGWYSMVVKDVRGCTTFGQTEVKVPDGLAVEPVLVGPTCFDFSDGSIALNVTGGRAPYAYQWQPGTGGAIRTGLPKGVYTVRIVDDNDCFVVREYTLNDPALLALDLGPDRVLCKDQTLPLDIAFDDPAPQYQWTKDGVPFAQTAAVELTDAGTYGATVTDSKGCSNTGDIRIERNEAEIAATLMVASRAPVSERVRITNISHPFPERVEWIIPTSAVVIEETPEYVDLMFASRDTYTVGMVSFVGSCEKVAYTSVKIVDKSQLTDYRAPDEPYIKQFTVTPNPNGGRFEATVELREAGDFSLTLTTLQGTAITSQSFKQQTFARAEFDVTSEVGKGVYILQLKTREGQATFKVVIQ